MAIQVLRNITLLKYLLPIHPVYNLLTSYENFIIMWSFFVWVYQAQIKLQETSFGILFVGLENYF